MCQCVLPQAWAIKRMRKDCENTGVSKQQIGASGKTKHSAASTLRHPHQSLNIRTQFCADHVHELEFRAAKSNL